MSPSRTQPPATQRPRHRPWVLVTLLVAALLAIVPATTAAAQGRDLDDVVVVANRGSGDVSVIDTRSLEVRDVDLPGEAEPMYVNHDWRHGRVLVGDRASSRVFALDQRTFDVVGEVTVGAGVFHQWTDPLRNQLWVVGDTSNTVTVVDTRTLSPIATIDIPADLVDRGGFPHDVFVRGAHAFVSILGLDEGVVLRYSTHSFEETGRIVTDPDPHLFVRGARLYVAAQGGNTVSTYLTGSLRPLDEIELPAAHGIFVTLGRDVFVTNIAGGGTDALWELDRRLRFEEVTDTDAPVPHNITVDRRGHVFVTHSGATADQVSVVERTRHGFGTSQLVTVGTNPFGLAFVAR